MSLALKAWRLREAAREALHAGNPGFAAELASRAEETQRTTAGKSLLAVASWLSADTEALPLT
jgi:phage shock protein A